MGTYLGELQLDGTTRKCAVFERPMEDKRFPNIGKKDLGVNIVESVSI